MRITFRVRFQTVVGQSLLLTGNHAIFGSGKLEHALPLEYTDDQTWQLTLELAKDSVPNAALVYNYALRNPDGSLLLDWGKDKTFNPASFGVEELLLVDSWNHAGFQENAFYTEPFRDVLLRSRRTEVKHARPPKTTHTFKVKAPLLEKGQTICLVGGFSTLGDWDTVHPVLMGQRAGEDFLAADLDLSGERFPIAYKYGVYDVERNKFVHYEGGGNRALQDGIAPGKQTIVNDGFAFLASNTWKGAGVALPVFSLRTERGFGVGEFADLKLLSEWCKQTGLKLIQVLPINDTIATRTWLDSYPYSAISAFALHPMYLNLEAATARENRRLLAEMEPDRKRLNALPALDYEAVLRAKLGFVRKIFPLQRAETFESEDFKRFFELNQHWLVPYAVFCQLRDRHGTPDYQQWPEEHRVCTAETLAALATESSPDYDEVALHYFIQFHLHLQLQDAARYAHANGVILKGDIAIGVYRYGADIWQQPDLFFAEVQAGAPPDPFAAKGQNWGFPTYNWPRMKEDGFDWWKRRFQQMGHYFDAFRIDHVLGFFRIWSIPLHAVEGILGYFVPAIPLELAEFAARGIHFDHARYTRPFITDQVLREVFGEAQPLVKDQFLLPAGPGTYALRTEFATQRQVEKHFASLEPGDDRERIKHGLYDLIGNVILFEVVGSQGRQFHFRFAMDGTPSFKSLDQRTQHQLRELYIDYFFRRQDSFWMKTAMEKLPALKRATNMLVCGEDLGLVPSCVPDVMRQLGLLSLEIQRMPKEMNREFSRPKDAPYLSVVTPSTHDMSTVRGWWSEDKNLAQRFYSQELGLPGQAPETCPGWLNRLIVQQHLASPAMWSIFQLQDLLGMDENLRRSNPEEERINVPANPRNYWRYRMHLSIESLLRAEAFNGELSQSLKQSGRQ